METLPLEIVRQILPNPRAALAFSLTCRWAQNVQLDGLFTLCDKSVRNDYFTTEPWEVFDLRYAEMYKKSIIIWVGTHWVSFLSSGYEKFVHISHLPVFRLVCSKKCTLGIIHERRNFTGLGIYNCAALLATDDRSPMHAYILGGSVENVRGIFNRVNFTGSMFVREISPKF